MTLDLSTLVFTPEPAKFSLVCNTPGITFSPSGQMAGGMATFEITATGQVPYDTTTSSNLINVTLTTNASPTYDQTGDSILVAYLDSQEETQTLYTGNLTWNDNVGTATFNCPITADSITYSPVIAIVIDETNATRVSQVLDTSALTLEPVPEPKFSLTNNTTGVTFSPNSQMEGGIGEFWIDATGQVPYDTTANANLLNLTITTNNVDWQNTDYFYLGYLGTGGTEIVLYTGSFTWNDGVGTATFNCPITADAISEGVVGVMAVRPDTVDPTDFTTIVSQLIDVSLLTLEAAPSPQVNVVIDTTKTPTLTLTPSTYSSTKALSGTVPISSGSNYLIGYVFTGSNIPALESGQHYYVEYFGSAGTRVGYEDFDSFTPGDPSYPVADMDYTATDFGTGKSISLKFSIVDSQFTTVEVLDTITIDTSAATPETPSPSYTVTGNYISLAPTDELVSGRGNAINYMTSATIDTTTAGTQADPWTANFTIKYYLGRYLIGFIVNDAFGSGITANNVNPSEFDNNNFHLQNTDWYFGQSLPRAIAWACTSQSFSPGTYTAQIGLIDQNTYQSITKYIEITISQAT